MNPPGNKEGSSSMVGSRQGTGGFVEGFSDFPFVSFFGLNLGL